MSRFKDLIGSVFNRLTVIKHIGPKPEHSKPRHYWLCRCSCSEQNEIEVAGDNLVSGQVQSCGCLQRERAAEAATTHGKAKTPEHAAWINMRNRCRYPHFEQNKNYAGAGIVVCKRYDESFEEFYADLGDRPSDDHSVDRINPKGHYSCGKCDHCREQGWPENVRWATTVRQARNKINTLKVTYNGETKPLADWADELGFDYGCLMTRLFTLKWPVERAFTEPSTPGRRRVRPVKQQEAAA